MFFALIALGCVCMLAVVGGVLARRASAPAGERRRSQRVPCTFRRHGAGRDDERYEGNVSAGGAMVVLPYAAYSSSLAVEAVDPGASAPVLLAGTVLSVEETDREPFGFAHHLRLDPNFRTPELEALVQRLSS